MAVEDHAVHESVKHAAPPAGCRDGERATSGYWKLVTVFDDTGYPHQRPVFIHHRMSFNCRQIGEYRNGQWNELAECVDCTTPRDWEYINRMRRLDKPV